MERIVYRITLDAHRNGIQRTLQGFETSDKMSRRIAVNIMASGNTFGIPTGNVVTMMYVTTPEATEPSINECAIEGNTIVYDVLPIVEEGLTEMQLKLIETGIEGAKSVLMSARFAVEVTKSNADDSSAEQSVTFTALEHAIARADAVYNARLERIELDKDCTFRAYYADGSVYENDSISNALNKNIVLMAQSWAVGGTGMREDEDSDNSKHYSDVSKSAAESALNTAHDARELLDEAKRHTVYTVL